ncbi:MAG: histidine kinase, partial [Chloroflexi bacterium]|nr:histidine kinase [Chloroflexota bacterium]
EQVKASLVEKEVLIKEIHHRVKNNLQIIHSMLNLQLLQVKDPQTVEMFKESQNRIYSMALIHETLYQSESMAKIDFSNYISRLISNLFYSYGVNGSFIRPILRVENVSLDIDTAIPCALVVNELVSNSLKHAFPASRHAEGSGEICIELHREAGNKFILTVSDNGIGLPEDFEMHGYSTLGLKLVSALVNQLRGEIKVSTGLGARFVFSFSGSEGAD